MATKRPTTIPEYIKAAPREGQPHLRRLQKLLKSVAPKAEEAIKWGAPFYVEPRFLFSFSACKAHLNFAPPRKVIEKFSKEMDRHQRTKYFLQVPYAEPLPETLIRKMAEYSVRELRKRKDDAFWW
jgi:uncharacterized protein YdhG (YjbR/CyaY superfamily)